MINFRFRFLFSYLADSSWCYSDYSSAFYFFGGSETKFRNSNGLFIVNQGEFVF